MEMRRAVSMYEISAHHRETETEREDQSQFSVFV